MEHKLNQYIWISYDIIEYLQYYKKYDYTSDFR